MQHMVVEWLAFRHANLGSQIWFPISAGQFSLVLPPSGQRLPKIAAIHSPQTGLVIFICICGSAAISLSHSSSEKMWKIWSITIKNLKVEPLMGRNRPSISLHQCLPATKVYDVKKSYVVHIILLMNIHATTEVTRQILFYFTYYLFIYLFFFYIKRALDKGKQKHVKKNSACRQTL